MNRDIFFIRRNRDDLPEKPPWELVLAVSDMLKKAGYDLRVDQESSYLFGKIVEAIKKNGITHYTDAVPLVESVLPDTTSQTESVDLLRSMIRTIQPKKEFLIIDQYIFTANPDPDYIPYLGKIFRPAFNKITRLELVTSRKRSKAVEVAFLDMIASAKRGIVTKIRYSSVFHDRLWIADKTRGLFVGTSLNGIGKRYAIADYLQKKDVMEIYARFQALP